MDIIRVGGFEVNCAILSESGKAWIVDPGQEAERIAGFLAEKALAPACILLTHGHFDHVGAIPGLQTAFPNLPVFVHADDRATITHPLNAFPPEYVPIAEPRNLVGREGLAGLGELEILETPGHTPGGVCFYFPHAAFGTPVLLSGDTLFAGSVGRIDLPGGDANALLDSLKKLAALPDETRVIPGHGPETTIGAERKRNRFLRR